MGISKKMTALSARSLICFIKRYSHVYKQNYVPSSKIAETLVKNVIYNENGILVLNKPYGISFSQDISKSKDDDPLNISLTTILPFLKKYLGYDQILNVRVPEKFISGVAVFSTDKRTQEILHMHLLSMRREGMPSNHYQTIVVGEPIKKIGQFKGAIKLVNSPTSSKEKRPILVESCSKKERVKGVAKSVIIVHRTVASNNNASLVEVASTRNSWHCVRTYLSTQLLTPVLGDNLYGSRVKTVLGQPVLMDAFNPVSDLPQKVSPEILAMLKLTSSRDVQIPLHLHLSKLIINCFDRKGTSLEFFTPPPETFIWTCNKLGLIKDDEISHPLSNNVTTIR